MSGNNGINTSSGTSRVKPLYDKPVAFDANAKAAAADASAKKSDGTKEIIRGAAKQAIGVGVSSLLNIMNAQSAYDALKSQNKINAMELDRAEGILLQQGHQTMLDLQRQGEENAVSAQLALAAQGQNLSSAGAEKVSESYKAMGVQNALIEEINMMRGVYDINFQRIEMKRAEGLAKAQKKNAIFSGIVTTAAAAAGGALGGAAGASAADAAATEFTQKDFSKG